MKNLKVILLSMILFTAEFVQAYPIDGYLFTGIRRLFRLQFILDGKIKDTKPIPGALKSIKDIKLNLTNEKGDSLNNFGVVDQELQKKLNRLFPNLNESYSICILDITEGKKTRYAERQSDRRFVPGSVGKLAIVAGLFNELQKLYPNSMEKRREVLRTRFTKAGRWAITNIHTVPFFNPETKEFYKRIVQEEDNFSLYEWADHMISVSSNAAASIVWKELILMRAFGQDYPVSVEEEKEFFSKTPKRELTKIAMAVVNEPLAEIGIAEKEWHLGSLFTSEGKRIVPGEGGSFATPLGFMKYLVALERGKIVDEESSLEIKRILYQTDRRIRYAQSPELRSAAVYFKSGSLYKCKPEPGFVCKKYMGNVENYMNSVAIVEHPDGTTYLVTLMSNVLRKNSGTDHMYLASQIDKIIKQ
jgi:hypothetical protein